MSQCVVPGCRNEVVRIFRHKDDSRVEFGVCMYHGMTIIRHGTDEQVNRYVFPQVPK